MDRTDVFVWVEGDDGSGAALAAKALRAKMKAPAGDWYLLAAKNEKLERLAYDLGMKALVRPASLAGLGELAAAHGTAPGVLFWSGHAVLVADWTPWQNDQPRMWDACPGALVRRADLPGAPVSGWFDLQALSDRRISLPLNQVKVCGPEDFDKAVHGGSGWPFGPSVVILEKPAPRR